MMKGREKQPRCFSKENMGKINVENMDLYYGQFHALKNINLDIPDVLKEDRNNHAISIGISATDQGNSDYFDTPNRVIATDLNRSKYIQLSLNGDSAKIKLKIF